MYTNEIKPGRLIYVEAREDNTTRLFVRSLLVINDAEKKQGWWNTFTITNQPVNKGMYIARIDKTTHDKDWNDMIIATVLTRINIDAINAMFKPSEWWSKTSIVQWFFISSGLFTESTGSYFLEQDKNYGLLYRKAKELDPSIELTKYDNDPIMSNHAKIVNMVIDNKITMEEIVAYLRTPTDEEVAKKNYEDMLEGFVENLDTHLDTYPMLVKAIYKKIEQTSKYEVRRNIQRIISDMLLRYDRAVNLGHIESVGEIYWENYEDPKIFDKIEAFLKFDAERKATNKAAKKAAKKSKKQAASESKANNN